MTIYDTPIPSGVDDIPEVMFVTVKCITEGCPDFDQVVQMTSVVGAMIVCGRCGQPVSAATLDEDAQG